ncbi:hypothetical protein EDB92DRAFT_702681 [Lactarius akahatsu]|uniref:Uncharacterized protein n=1 Tax=Lactarius akahatsu TaxID=416441 RepID=A0AAD4QAJ8_9AGAM|nr:hypothetical protein EDB92DRAFT_702681 [Lactarius akahatsu]
MHARAAPRAERRTCILRLHTLPVHACAFSLHRTLHPVPPRARRRRTHLSGRPRRRYRRLPLSDSFAARGLVDGNTHDDEGDGEDEGSESGHGSVLSHAGRARVRYRFGAGPRVAGVRPTACAAQVGMSTCSTCLPAGKSRCIFEFAEMAQARISWVSGRRDLWLHLSEISFRSPNEIGAMYRIMMDLPYSDSGAFSFSPDTWIHRKISAPKPRCQRLTATPRTL